MKERSLLAMLLLAFAGGRATSFGGVDQGRRGVRSYLYLFFKWAVVALSLQAVLRNEALNNAAAPPADAAPRAALPPGNPPWSRTLDAATKFVDVVWRGGFSRHVSRK